MLGRGDLWIVNEYETSHSWLAPSEEDVFLWPYSNDGATMRMTFSREKMSSVIAWAISASAQIPAESIGDTCVCLRMPIAPDDIYLPVMVTSSIDHFKSILTRDPLESLDEIELVDSDDRLTALSRLQWDRLLCIEVCTMRFDDSQHVIVAVRNDAVVWEAWTVEEDFIVSNRVAERTIQVLMKRAIFLFDRDRSMLSSFELVCIRRLLNRLFRDLPDDVIDLIAAHVHQNTRHVTSAAFHRGACGGVFNYAIARLLRVAHHTAQAPSLRAYHQMTPGERLLHYHVLKAALRSRRRIFDRRLCKKTTRSGHGY